MKVSLNWLKSLVDMGDLSLEEIDKLFSFNIVEIEEIKKLVNATNLTIGEVLECVPHTDSDHLHVCKVNLGDKIEQIVCGAPNVCAGIKVIVSKVGAVLPGDFKIKASKVRGIESNGMICSLQELGIEEKYVPEAFKNGIYILDEKANPGDDPLKYLFLDDVMVDLNLTPNRADLLSHLGVAYDVAAVMNKKVNYQMPVVHEIDIKNPMSVSVLTDKCQVYSCRYVKDVKIKESPNWLKARLVTCGIRPINNVVDITNYVLLELGEPLHAFDAAKLGNKIVVRNALNNEKTNTLDDEERTLSSDDCVITDGNKIVAVAGVMGGLDTSVSSTTTDVVIEAAYFDPLSIRKTSSKLNLRSESSVRFERKVDPARVSMALDRACELLEQLADGKVLKGVCKEKEMDVNAKAIDISVDRINSMLGTNISENEIKDIFTRLGFTVSGEKMLHVLVPTRRVDIEMYQDLVEEVARIYGYNNIPSTIPSSNVPGHLSPKQKMIRSIKATLEGLGNKEVVTYTLVGKNDVAKYNNALGKPIDLQMPMTEDRSTVRQSQLNGIVDCLKYNTARQLTDISIYEMGRVYYDNDKEVNLLTGALTGKHSKLLWQGKKEDVDFYFVKGMLEVLFEKIGVNVEFVKGTDIPKAFHPGRTADIVLVDKKKGINKKIGVLGAMHPKYVKNLGLNETYLYEISLEDILNVDLTVKRFTAIPKFPSVSRDIALIVDKNIEVKAIMDLVRQTGKKVLIDANVFDVYEGSNIDSDKKSIAISLTFQDSEKTLEALDVDKRVKQIVDRLAFVLHTSLRS